VVWAKRALGWSEVKVKLGRSNRRQVEVLDGVVEGDRLSAVDLALPEAQQAAGPGGASG
jgi:hypothetical protein